MTPVSPPARADEAVTLDFQSETLVYHLRTGEVHRLDPIGAMVWRLLDGHTTVDEIVPDLAAAFGTDEAVVRRDVEGLVAKLIQAFLLAGSIPSRPSRPRRLTNPPSR